MKYTEFKPWIVALLFFTLTAKAQNRTNLPTHQLKRAHRAEWLKVIRWSPDCEEAFQKLYRDPNYSGLEFYQTGKQSFLVQITCYPGAYQPGSLFASYDAKNGNARLLKFKGIESRAEQGKELAYSEIDGLTTWRSKSRILEIFSKYRGTGDCGFFGRYRIALGQPVLFEAREQDCDDLRTRRSVNPRQWPRKKL